MGSIFFLMASKFSGFSPRCAYFFGFKRFSKNGKKVNDMDTTEAKVSSRVKNLYIYFFCRYCWTLWDAKWCQNNDFFSGNRSFSTSSFSAPSKLISFREVGGCGPPPKLISFHEVGQAGPPKLISFSEVVLQSDTTTSSHRA